MRMIEEGSYPIFTIIRKDKGNYKGLQTMSSVTRKIIQKRNLKQLQDIEDEDEEDDIDITSPDEMALKEEEEEDHQIFEKKQLSNQILPGDNHEFLYDRVKVEDDHARADEFPLELKRETLDQRQPLMPLRGGKYLKLLVIMIESPRGYRDPFVLSPLYASHQGFFNGFTPRTFFQTPRLMNPNQNLAFENFMLGGGLNPQFHAIDFNHKMDKILNNLHMDIQGGAGRIEDPNKNKEDFDLDIDLINDTYGIGPTTKSSTGEFKFPNLPKSTGSSFRHLGTPNY
jgi:hypothetical protein